MKFNYIKSHLNGTFVPQEVFDNIHDARNNDLKVILYVIQNQDIDPLKISSDLDISLSAVNSSLLYWADKNLIACQEEESKKKRKPALTSEIIASYANDPNVSALCQNLQLVFKTALSEKYTNKFIGLYLEDFIPVDVILQITHHFISIGIDNPAYILKVVKSWYTKYNLVNGQAVDSYLNTLAAREKVYKTVCRIFSYDFEKLKTNEKKIIDKWQENYKMSFEMIEQSYLRAGNLASIPYCNGILKSWAQKGYSTIDDLQNEISNIAQSSKNIDSQQDLIAESLKNVPVFEG